MSMLDSLVRELSFPETKLPYPADKVFLVKDPATKKITTAKPLWGGAKQVYYLVSPAVTEFCPTARFEVSERGETMTVAIAFTFTIARGHEKAFLHNFEPGVPPSETLQAAIDQFNSDFVRDCFRNGVNPFDQFDAVYDDWSKHLVVRLARQFSLDATAAVTLPGYTSPFEISNQGSTPLSFVVHANDCDDNIPLAYTVGVEPSPGAAQRPPRKYLPPVLLRQKMQIEMGRFIHEQCGLHELTHDEEAVKAKLRARLNQWLESYGLNVRFINLQATPPFGRDLRESFRHDVHCTIDPRETKLCITHNLRLTWTNVGDLRRVIKDQAQLEAWLQRVLAEATHDELGHKSYSELVVDFEEVKVKIKARVKARLLQAGCLVQQLVTAHNLTHGQLIENGFRVNLSTEEGKPETEYRTADSDVNFGLRISVSGSFDLKRDRVREKLLGFIKPELVFEELVRTEIHAWAQAILERLDPETLYLYFSHLPEEPVDGGVIPPGRLPAPGMALQDLGAPPKRLLELEVTQKMSDRFGATCTVNFVPVDTRLGNLFRDLLHAAESTIPISVKPKSAHDVIPCKVIYKVRGMARNGWRGFQNSCRNLGAGEVLERIAGAITTQASRDLATLSLEDLAFQSYRQASDIEANVFDPTLHKIREDFGLAVRVTFDRGETGDEELGLVEASAKRADFAREMQNRRTHRASQLANLRAKLETDGAGMLPELLEELQREIGALEREAAHEHKPHLPAPRPAPRKDAPQPSKIEDFRPSGTPQLGAKPVEKQLTKEAEPPASP
jgi:hypothetical protein